MIATWNAFHDRNKINYFIDLGRARLIKEWGLSESVFSKLTTIVNETEASAVKAYTTCKSGNDMEQFFSCYASRVAGNHYSFEMSSYEALLSGRQTMPGLSFIETGALARVFTETCVSTKALLESTEVDWGVEQAASATMAEVESGKQSESLHSTSEYRGDYGNLSMLPSPEAVSILSSMTDNERMNFDEILKRLQNWHQSSAGQGVTFHPEARAAYWGLGLAKIAEHYRDAQDVRRALFFASAAWNISRYPVFAHNAAMLSLQVGDNDAAQRFLGSYLADYKNVLTTSMFTLIDPDIKAQELEDMALAAQGILDAIRSGM